jgi:SAM-dependent methyltransferase
MNVRRYGTALTTVRLSSVGVAPDGSPVEVYLRLPSRGEGELVAAALPPPASLLELGCGTGRVTQQLVARGYSVVAVDESPEMLAHVRGAETVCARIEELDLGRRFDAVLLLSNLLTVEPGQRQAFLGACSRHSDLLVVETLPLAWQPPETESLRIDRIEGGVVHGEVSYDGGWSHAFAMRVFADEAELAEALGEWRLDRWLDRDRGWLTAVRAARRAMPGAARR